MNNNNDSGANQHLSKCFHDENLFSKIKSNELLRKLSSITFRTAVHLEKEIATSCIEKYYNLFFISSILTSFAFDSSNSASSSKNHTHIVFGRYQYSFNAYKNLLACDKVSLPEDINNIWSTDLSILTRSILRYILSHNAIQNKSNFIQKLVNMIIGNQARWQRKYKEENESYLSQELWTKFSKSILEEAPGINNSSSNENNSCKRKLHVLSFIELLKLINFTFLKQAMKLLCKKCV